MHTREWRPLKDDFGGGSQGPFYHTPQCDEDVKKMFWWSRLKRDIAELVSKCLVCQKVKIKHQKALCHIVTTRDFEMEIGEYLHGLCDGFTQKHKLALMRYG